MVLYLKASSTVPRTREGTRPVPEHYRFCLHPSSVVASVSIEKSKQKLQAIDVHPCVIFL
jgi:hypothetical protein